MKYKIVETCRCCGSKELLCYLDLKKQPLANSYHKKTEHLEKYELKVNVCKECFHSQLSITVDPKEMFKNYLYVSGTTKTFNVHCEQLAKYAKTFVNKERVSVMDIGSNDGTLLQKFKEIGCEVFGVDPAENLRELTKQKEIEVIVDFWSEELSNKIHKNFDIITGTNVFAHVDDAYGFLKGCYNRLNEDGVLILEFPYAGDFINKVEFDTVYHEHLSYFCIKSFKTLANRVGLNICDIVFSNIHGGSVRFCLSKNLKETSAMEQILEEERNKNLYNLQSYVNYQNKVNEVKSLFEKFCLNNKVIGYAASAKGNTAINYFNATDIMYIVDDNSLKCGYYTPGSDIEIKDVKTGLDTNEHLNIIIFSWNFKEEIKKKILDIRGGKSTNLVYYVPDFYVEEINGG